MRGTELVFDALRQEGIHTVFMVPGGVNDAFMPPMTGTPGITTVVAAHEGGAAYMADGSARASGRFGVAFGIGGPGIFNMTTALASSFSDRTRVLAISGEVPTNFEGRGAFQDASGAALDDVGVARPVTGLSVAAEDPAVLPVHLRRLVTHMVVRRVPVHLSVPTDVQQAEVDDTWDPLPDTTYHSSTVDVAALDPLWATLAGARTITALAGPGIRNSDASGELIEFAERFGIPVATTLVAKGVMPEDHPLSLGVFGYAGSRWATDALLSPDVDVLLVLGSGLTQRDTMYWDDRLRPRQAIVHVDFDATLIGRTWPAVPVVGDPRAVLRALLGASDERAAALEASAGARRTWLERVQAGGSRHYDEENCTSDATPIHPARAISELRTAAPHDTVMCVDSGAHRAWAGHYWSAYGPRDYVTATNLGPMGAAVPLAVGAKLARPDVPCAVVVGDGCMLMHGMELHTAVREGVPIVVVVMNNRAYGNIWFRAHTMGPGPEALTDITGIDWAAFARSLGADAATVTEPDQLAPAFATAFASSRPFLVDVHVDKQAAKPTTPWTDAVYAWEDDH
ncbi:MAG TPA: thiamine pyrophosphate-binding protein [Acidimicrobiia bacterium]